MLPYVAIWEKRHSEPVDIFIWTEYYISDAFRKTTVLQCKFGRITNTFVYDYIVA